MPSDEPTWDNTTEVEPTWDNTSPVQTQQETPPQPSRIPSAYIPPDVEKEVTQKFDETHPILGNAAQAFGETVSGFIPRSVEQVGQLATPVVGAVEDIGKAGMSLRDVLFGGQTTTQAAEANYPESLQLRQAEQTPPFSKERFAAGFGTLANIGMAAAIGRGLPLRDVLFGRENPTVTAATESVVEPTVQPVETGTIVRPIQPESKGFVEAFATMKGAVTDSYVDSIWKKVQEGKPIQRIAPLENQLREAQKAGQLNTREDVERIVKGYGKTEGEPNAIQPSTTQVEAGTAAQRVEAGTEGNVPATGRSDNVVGEAQGTEARGEIPARQGTEAQVEQPQTPAVTEPTTAIPTAKTEPAATSGTAELQRSEIPRDASVNVRARTPEGDELTRNMNAREAEGIFTKERSSLRALLDCLG